MLLAALTVGAALWSALPAAAQISAEPPLAKSSNVQVGEHVPGSFAGMTFKDHYAFLSGWGGITVLDIAQAESPRVVGDLPLPHFENEDVDLCGNILMVVNDRAEFDLGSILYVVNIANPTTPTLAAVMPLGWTAEHRPRLRPHRQLREVGLQSGVDRRRRSRGGRRPHRAHRAEVARQVRVGRC